MKQTVLKFILQRHLRFNSIKQHSRAKNAGNYNEFLPAAVLYLICAMRCYHYLVCFVFVWLLQSLPANAQQGDITFRHLTVKNGLNDGIINAIAQDKYGYMWFASYGAINRFNGTAVKKYEHISGDSTSAPGSIVYAMHCTAAGRLFAGTADGLVEFDYETEKFTSIKVFNGLHITALDEFNKDELLVVANRQLVSYSYDKKTTQYFNKGVEAGLYNDKPIFSITRKADFIYAGTYGGYIICDIRNKRSRFTEVKTLSGFNADAIAIDAANNIWLSNVFSFKLIRYNTASGTETAMHTLQALNPAGVQQSYLDFAVDDENVWIVTSLSGLIQYHLPTQKIILHKKNLLNPGSIAENILRTIYRASDGTIWISMLGGIDYFHPKKNFFHIIFPFPDVTANQLARGFSEDREGNYWFTTGDGVTRYNATTGLYKLWRNEAGKPPAIYYNSSRAVLADGNNVWIATGKGINRYNITTGKMQFLTAKDSLPEIFYLNINKTTDGTIWFCSNQQDGLYYFNPGDKKIHSIKHHPVLKQYSGYGVRRVFEDSKKRWWFGFDGKGYAMYNPQNNKTQYWYNITGKDSSYNSNLVIDITEDKNRMIWLSTFHGVYGIDADNGKKFWLSTADGLPSNITNGITADAWNRLWISTSAGLSMADSTRKSIISFDESYGFASQEFSQYQAHITSKGDFVFPSNKGYVFFKPAALPAEHNQLACYIATLNVFDKPFTKAGNLKSQSNITLSPDENFFTVLLEALNYTNAAQTWFAYKLDGLENEWHYTQDARAVYTNVAGGDYTFKYKATNNLNNWGAEKLLHIKVKTAFYKTTWFRLLLVLALFAGFYFLYRFRLKKQRQILILQSKAQMLEKEKTQVLFESLKQQLNPHFLFNSLTSLAGLIESDRQQAGNFLKQMSKIYRYILKSRDNELVTLKEEIEVVQVYINLQQTRFKHGLQVKLDISEEYYSRKLPPVTLQNMVENAIKHNIIDIDTPLIIRIFVNDDYLVVQNNLQKKQVVETSNKQGLAGLQSLYKYLSERPLVIEETKETFTIKLPLI